MKEVITVQVAVKAPVETVWKCWTSPDDIMKWNHASDEWYTPHAANDLRPGGAFLYRMEAKDRTFGFDFHGVYDKVQMGEAISYTIGDGRKVSVIFRSNGGETEVVETFEAEHVNPVEKQRDGWQAILNNFKKHVEATR